MSLSNGIVPDELKIAKVVPIYKKENPEVSYFRLLAFVCVCLCVFFFVFVLNYLFVKGYNIFRLLLLVVPPPSCCVHMRTF